MFTQLSVRNLSELWTLMNEWNILIRSSWQERSKASVKNKISGAFENKLLKSELLVWPFTCWRTAGLFRQNLSKPVPSKYTNISHIVYTDSLFRQVHDLVATCGETKKSQTERVIICSPLVVVQSFCQLCAEARPPMRWTCRTVLLGLSGLQSNVWGRNKFK